MKKCDFCTWSLPNGECYFGKFAIGSHQCEKAIKLMVAALKRRN